MLSSFGFDPKGAGRNIHSVSRFLPNVPRGFSVHVFKNLNPTLPTHAPPPVIPPVVSRPSTGGGQWTRQQSYHNDMERKQVAVIPSQDRRLVQVGGAVNQAWPLERKYSQSTGKSGKPYGIYPSLKGDIYIYERSISSVSQDDELSPSPLSDSSSSSESDLFPLNNTATRASEISSIRASSSTETLESTLTPARAPNVPSSILPPPPRPALQVAVAASPRPASTRPPADNTAASRPVIPLTRTSSIAQRNIAVSRTGVPPIQLASAPLDNSSDSDSDTVISESHVDSMVVDMLGAQWTAPSSMSYPTRGTTPFRRDSNDRVAYGAPPLVRTSSRDARDLPSTRPVLPPAQYQYRAGSPGTEDTVHAHPRAPPGLPSHAGGVATAPDGSPRGARDPASSSSASHSPGSRSPPSAQGLARSVSSRPQQAPPPPAGSPPGPHPRSGETSLSHSPPSSGFVPPLSSSPTRRDARAPSPHELSPQSAVPPPYAGAGAMMGAPQVQMPSPQEGGGMLVVATNKRSVRWTEDLVCPSPVPVEKRRKGWYNRRGDQLWTNDGQYKVPEPGQEYPPDLAYYPEPNSGWMNEEGIRIDMQHRLIPKQPLRPALKRAKPFPA